MASYDELMDSIKSYYALYMENTDAGNAAVSEIAKLSYTAQSLKIDTRMAIKSKDPQKLKTAIRENSEMLSKLISLRKSLDPDDFSTIKDFSKAVKIIGSSIISISNIAIGKFYDKKIDEENEKGKTLVDADGCLKASKEDSEEALDILASVEVKCATMDLKARAIQGAVSTAGGIAVDKGSEKIKALSYNAAVRDLDKVIAMMIKAIRRLQKAFP